MFLGIISIVITSILMIYIPQYREVLSILLGTSIALLITGFNELGKYYSSTARLELRKVVEPLDDRTIRLFVEAYNKDAVTIRDAKAVLIVLVPSLNIVAKHLVKNRLDNRSPCPLASACRESRSYPVSRLR